MPHVPGLRRCNATVGRLVYFGRMLDKIRLHAAGKLPADYVANLGDSQMFVLDGRCCRFLGVKYGELKERTLATTAADDVGRSASAQAMADKKARGTASDEELLAWAHAHGTPRTDEECHMWNRLILKLGWRDERSAVLTQRIRDSGLR